MSSRLILSALFALMLAVRLAARAETPAAPAPAEAKPAAPASAEAKPAAPATAAKPGAPAAAEAKPAAQIEGSEPQKGSASRDKDTLTVDFPDEDIKTILRNVADLFELNLVVPDTLTGKTSIKLRDVTWRQIFQVVLSPANYTYVEEGNIIKIVSNESLTQEPVATEVIIINNAKASDINTTVSGMIEAAAGGKIVVDARSNALVITERPSRMTRIRTTIEALDKATDQVMIESKFVEVSDSDVKNIGVNWSSLANYRVGVGSMRGTADRARGQLGSEGFDRNLQNNSGTQNATNTTAQNTQTNSSTNTLNPTTTNTVTSTNGTITNTSTTGNNTSVNTIAGTNATTATTATNDVTKAVTDALANLQSLTNTDSTNRLMSAVFSANDFNIVLNALQTQQKSKIVSNPTVVTLNNTEATINVGTERPLPRYTFNQQTGTLELSGFDYKPIGIILKVTPQVNARGFIKLTVEPEVSQSTRDVDMKGIPVPVIDTRKAKTQVSLKDGYTMGIGGLVSEQARNGGSRVPLLSSIPGLGRLFRTDTKNVESTNLIIFITARTLSAEGAAIEQVFDSNRVRGLEMKREDLPGYRDGSDPFLPAAAPAVKAGKKATAPPPPSSSVAPDTPAVPTPPAAAPVETPPAPEKKPFFRLTRPGK